MPSTYSTLFLSGQGLAGIFAAFAMLMSMASEWTWMAGGVGWPLRLGSQRGCAEGAWIFGGDRVMEKWGLGLGARLLGSAVRENDQEN